jgi:hypothetical protein
MKFAILQCRPAARGLLISICILLGLLTVNPAVAQDDIEESLAPLRMPIGDEVNNYAELVTLVPPAAEAKPVEQETLNYPGGKDIKTSFLLNGSAVDIFLLYPCQPPEVLLDAEGLKSLLATADESITLANYSENELFIADKPAIWGVLGSKLLAAYQPTNQTAALIVMDSNLDEYTLFNFLVYMNITVDESLTPIPPGYCSDATAVDGADAIAADATGTAEATIDGAAAVDTSASTGAAAAVTQTASGLNQSQSRKEKAEADRAAAMARLEEAKAAMRN